MITRLRFSFRILILCCCVFAPSVYAIDSADGGLKAFVSELKKQQSVNVHINSDNSVLLSWSTSDPRRVDKKTVSILKHIGKYSEKVDDLSVRLTVFANAKSTRLSNQAKKNTDYKARRIADSLSKKTSRKTEVSAVGMGSEIPYNLIFASIERQASNIIPAVVAVPVKAR